MIKLVIETGFPRIPTIYECEGGGGKVFKGEGTCLKYGGRFFEGGHLYEHALWELI